MKFHLLKPVVGVNTSLSSCLSDARLLLNSIKPRSKLGKSLACKLKLATENEFLPHSPFMKPRFMFIVKVFQILKLNSLLLFSPPHLQPFHAFLEKKKV